MGTETIRSLRAWGMLSLGLVATMSATTFINGVAFLIPALDRERGISLAEAGLLSAMPSVGMVFTLIAWGYLVDRFGERFVLTAGLGATSIAVFAAASVHGMAAEAGCLLVGGAAAASANTASGRLVTGWFPVQQRGLAMGIRQTAQPLGIAVAALVLPELGERDFNVALLFPAAACAISAAACAFGVRDPHRPTPSIADPQETANPYRRSAMLWRIHLVSALLMIPQTVVLTFMLVWLMRDHHWSVGSAGVLVSVSQLLGALGRVAVGRWSDRVGARMGPVRMIAVAAALCMLALALADRLDSALAIPLMVVGAVVTVLDNGLAFTAVAESAGRYWSGRAMGAQNTTQRLTAGATPPIFGEIIDVGGYPTAFAVCGAVAVLALPLIPVGPEKRQSAAAAPAAPGRDAG
ncbi:MFS transporter [Mycolicibacillus koreensis]|nr:MFS transporter [Mycolicibacillus koreensis]BBY54508.1 MFS transporter [Mycolicibacillus koreensis]